MASSQNCALHCVGARSSRGSGSHTPWREHVTTLGPVSGVSPPAHFNTSWSPNFESAVPVGSCPSASRSDFPLAITTPFRVREDASSGHPVRPSTKSVQFVLRPVPVLKRPRAQAWHSEAAVLAKRLDGQSEHSLCPANGAYVPATHSLHSASARAGSELDRPATHSTQLVLAFTGKAFRPASHTSHAVAPVSEVCRPLGHSLHSVAAVPVLMRPGVQEVHVGRLFAISPRVPGGHRTQLPAPIVELNCRHSQP